MHPVMYCMGAYIQEFNYKNKKLNTDANYSASKLGFIHIIKYFQCLQERTHKIYLTSALNILVIQHDDGRGWGQISSMTSSVSLQWTMQT